MRSTTSTVEEYFHSEFLSQLPAGFEKFRQASDQAGRTSISLGPLEAGLLQTLVRLQNKPKWVEIGTLTGFSALCLISALPPGGHLWTLEKDPQLALTARSLFEKNGVAARVTVVQGDAALTLPTLAKEGPFDGIFIDGNKSAYLSYLDWADQHLGPQGLILADNVFLGGDIWASEPSARWSESNIMKMRQFINRLFDSSKYQTSLVPTNEGLLVARKKY